MKPFGAGHFAIIWREGHDRAAILSPVANAEGFTWEERSNGDVVIRHHGRHAAILRGVKARAFLANVGNGDDQQLMARLTGNYKRGNERQPRS